MLRRNFKLLILAVANPPAQASSTERGSFVPKNDKDETITTLHGYKPFPLWAAVSVIAIVIAAAAAPGITDSLEGPRLTVFGALAAQIAVFALSATTLCASILPVSAYGAGRRIISPCGYVRSQVLHARASGPLKSPDELLGLWSGGARMPVSFAVNPVLAGDNDAGAFGLEVWEGTTDRASTDKSKSTPEDVGKAWANELAKMLFDNSAVGVTPDDSRGNRPRLALFSLLVSELSVFRWIASGAAFCAFAGAPIVYFYPIEADTLLILNLLVLALTGVLCAYLTVAFEREAVLSNVVCNRPQKMEISMGLFSYIASPFVALAAAAALIGIPGVVDWAGGLYAMLRSLGIHH